MEGRNLKEVFGAKTNKDAWKALSDYAHNSKVTLGDVKVSIGDYIDIDSVLSEQDDSGVAWKYENKHTSLRFIIARIFEYPNGFLTITLLEKDCLLFTSYPNDKEGKTIYKMLSKPFKVATGVDNLIVTIPMGFEVFKNFHTNLPREAESKAYFPLFDKYPELRIARIDQDGEGKLMGKETMWWTGTNTFNKDSAVQKVLIVDKTGNIGYANTESDVTNLKTYLGLRLKLII